MLLDLALSVLGSLLGQFKLTSGIPVAVLNAIQAAIDAVAAHKDDVVTRAAIEVQRGDPSAPPVATSAAAPSPSPAVETVASVANVVDAKKPTVVEGPFIPPVVPVVDPNAPVVHPDDGSDKVKVPSAEGV